MKILSLLVLLAAHLAHAADAAVPATGAAAKPPAVATPASAPSTGAAAKPPAPEPSPAAAPPADSGSPSSAFSGEDMTKFRDPFKRPDIDVLATAAPKSELEKFPIDGFKLVGAITGPNHVRAMVLAPDGHTYSVIESTRIGLRNGYVKQIRPDAIVVREKVVNVLGQEEDVDTVLTLPAEKDKGGG